MTDAMLVNLMSGLDVSLLENNYLEEDLRRVREIRSKRILSRIGGLKEGSEFVIRDGLRENIAEETNLQSAMREREEKLCTEIGEKLEVKVDAVKKRINRIWAIVTGILTMAVVAASVTAIINKKKSSQRLLKQIELSRRVQSTI